MKAVRWVKWIVVFLIVVLVGARLALPYVLKDYVNRTLSRINGYRGHVDDIDVALWRGAYAIVGGKLERTGGKVPVPFFSAPRVDLSVEWKALFHGAVVGEIKLDQPKLNFVSGPSERESQTGVDASWQRAVRDLFPLKINRFEAVDASIHFRAFHTEPPVDVSLDRLHVVGTNLTNSLDISKSLVAVVQADGRAEKHAKAHMNLELDPYAEPPSFSLDASIKDLDLTRLNDLLRAFWNFDVKKGVFEAYLEIAAKNGRVSGYVKPIFSDVEVLDLGDDISNPFKFLWQSIVSVVLEVVTNQGFDQVAARIPLEGELKNPDVDLWSTVTSLLANAFIRAIAPGLEGTINISKVGGKRKDGEAEWKRR